MYSSTISPSACRYVIMTHIIHSSDTVKDCAPSVVHALVTFLGAICRLHSLADVTDAARNWARLCEALVSVHLKATVKQVQLFFHQTSCVLSLSYIWPRQYVTVAIESWLRLRTSLLVPMELLQPLEGGVLALVSCCDKKQVMQLFCLLPFVTRYTLSTKSRNCHQSLDTVADPADSLMFISRCTVSFARVGAAARHELQVHRDCVTVGHSLFGQ